MKNEERLVVDGYLYGNDADVKLAKEEKKTIEYLETKINYDDIQTTLKIYNKAVKDRIFKTPVGFEFLKKMRAEMIKRGMPEENIGAIPLYQIFSKEADVRPVRVFQIKENKSDNKEILRVSLWANIVLVVLVIGMFVLTLFGDNTNILNYKYKIENEYSIWQQELEEREAVIREKEAELRLE
ncbi:MAG: hypothetical protein E7299_04755 [Lachnospiraceae bacterium]|nr:hypothetical protein [Lachnospiraceae bacterium]